MFLLTRFRITLHFASFWSIFRAPQIFGEMIKIGPKPLKTIDFAWFFGESPPSSTGWFFCSPVDFFGFGWLKPFNKHCSSVRNTRGRWGSQKNFPLAQNKKNRRQSDLNLHFAWISRISMDLEGFGKIFEFFEGFWSFSRLKRHQTGSERLVNVF